MGQQTYRFFKFDEGLARVIHETPTLRIEAYSTGEVSYARSTLVRPSWREIIVLGKKRVALERVGRIGGVEQLVETGQNYIITQHPTGKPLTQAKYLPVDYFDEVRIMLGLLHSRRVAGLNYRNPNGLLVDIKGNPIIPDLSAAKVYDPIKQEYAPLSTKDFWELMKKHFWGQFNRDIRPPQTFMHDLAPVGRVRNRIKLELAKRQEEAFERTKKMDRGFILSLEIGNHLRTLTAEEDSDLNYFLSEKLII